MADFVRRYAYLAKRQRPAKIPPNFDGHIALRHQTRDLSRLAGEYRRFEFERHDARFDYVDTGTCTQNTISGYKRASDGTRKRPNIGYSITYNSLGVRGLIRKFPYFCIIS